MQQHGGFVQPGPLEGSKLTLPAQTLAGNDGSYRDQVKGIALGTGLSMSGGVLRAVGSAFDGAVATWADLPVGLVTPVVESVYLVRNGSGLWLLNRKKSGLWQRVAATGDRAADWNYLGEWLEEFSDANFEVWHDDDTSRGLKFSLADQPTGTTVTVRSNDLGSLGTMAAGWSGVSGHLLRTDNPHSVTAAQVGLGSVDNTRDSDKPVSTAQAAALGARAPLVHEHAATDISDSTYVGRGLLTAASAAVQRNLIGVTPWATNQWTDGTTSDIPEGTQLYFTNARADARAALIVSAHNVAGDSHADIRTALAGKQDAGSFAGSSTPGGAATTALACTGNAATATTAASCTGNSATATTASSCSGNAATATKLATPRTLTIGSKANTFDGSADRSWSLADIGAVPTLYTVDMGGDAADWTTADFIAFLTAQGAFNVRQWSARGSWDYGKNSTISDTGVGRLSLAGAVVEVFGIGNASQYIVRVLSAPTSNTGGMVNSIFVYSNYGSPFSPGWTRFTKSYEFETVSNALWAALYAEQTGGITCEIPLAATGDGSGVLTLRLWSDVANTATLSNGAFYGEIGGTTNLGQSVAMTAWQHTTFYIKLPVSTTATLTITYGWALTKWGQIGTEFVTEATNAPKLNGLNTKYIPANVSTIRIYPNMNYGAVTGSTYPWAASTCIVFIGGQIAIGGTTYAWTKSTEIIFTSASTIGGTAYEWAAATFIYFVGALMTISVNLSKSCLTSGNLYITLYGAGIQVTYPTTRVWPTTMRQIYLCPSVGSMPTADTDRMFIDVNTYCTTSSNEKVLDARGNCGAVTAASSAARASLAAKGFAVSYNS